MAPNGHVLKSTLSNGVAIYGKNTPGYGGRGVYLYRDEIEPELQLVEDLLDPDSVFVDIGANTGVYSLKVAKRLYKGIVISIEPIPELLSMLQHSLEENKFNNIRLRNLCVGRKTEARTLWSNGNRPCSFSISCKIGEPVGISVLTVALDDLFEWEGLGRLDYLKIDAEGAETEILEGGLETLQTYRPIVQLETIAKDAALPLEAYLEFKLPYSPNKICVPEEHPKRSVLEQTRGCCLL